MYSSSIHFSFLFFLTYLKGYCYFTDLLFSQLDESNSPHLPLQTRFLRPLTIFVVLNFLHLVHFFLVCLYFSQQQDIVDSYLACDHWNHWILSCRNATLAVYLHHVFTPLIIPTQIYLAVVSLLKAYLFSQTISSICNNFTS